MEESLLREFLLQYFSIYEGRVRFIWHGGEPLLAGIPFFESVIRFQEEFKAKEQRVENHLQTNGTLLNDEWATFFKKHNFRIGISLDGAEQSHDRYRRDVSGEGTFHSVVNGINTLRRHGLYPGIIQTVSKLNVQDIRKDLEFLYTDLQMKGWAINVCDANYSDIPSLGNQDVLSIHRECIQFWQDKQDPDLSIREIDNLIAGLMGRRPPNCSFNGMCGSYFCLDNDGTIYPCDRLSYHSDLAWGSLKEKTLKAILMSSKARHFCKQAHLLPADCTRCEWKNACNNGCTAMRDDNGKYSFCDSRKTAFSELNAIIAEYQNSLPSLGA